MGTFRKVSEVRRSSVIGAAKQAGSRAASAPATAGEPEAATVEAVTAVVRRFRRGRWTLTALPV